MSQATSAAVTALNASSAYAIVLTWCPEVLLTLVCTAPLSENSYKLHFITPFLSHTLVWIAAMKHSLQQMNHTRGGGGS